MTALQELINIIKDKRKESDISNTLLRFCQVEAEKLLQKEKKQIIDAYCRAEDKSEFFEYEHRYGREYLTSEDYYNEIFVHNPEAGM